jgi:hypothetical protein
VTVQYGPVAIFFTIPRFLDWIFRCVDGCDLIIEILYKKKIGILGEVVEAKSLLIGISFRGPMQALCLKETR